MYNTLLLLASADEVNSTTIQNVTAQDFSGSIVSIISVFYNSIAPIVIPLAKLGLLISAIVLLVGAISMSKSVKKVGWGGIITTLAVLFLFYLGPLIFNLIVTATKAGLH
ncbi:hypothetical protein [Clostridium tyrobutyricum]|jgi:hypothetical protein|uniref:hypothetical protein n=1 Tax=Clostridium tyrobutyricum TaxID=1519 RepID=UPI0011CA838B|nr:hypothetical protein [Clostridium tyrobutyricum]